MCVWALVYFVLWYGTNFSAVSMCYRSQRKRVPFFSVILHCFWSFKRMEKENQAWGNSRMFSSRWKTKTENVSVYFAVVHTLEHGSAQLAHYKKSDREAIKVQYYYTYVTRSLCDIMHAHGFFFILPLDACYATFVHKCTYIRNALSTARHYIRVIK